MSYTDFQRVYVTTAQDVPSFLVHEVVRDEFIAELVTERYGTQENGQPHEWEAFDIEVNQIKVAVA